MTGVVSKALKGNFAPGFMLKHFIKDMNISSTTSKDYQVSLPVLDLVLKEAKTLEDKGLGTEGTQTLLKYYTKK